MIEKIMFTSFIVALCMIVLLFATDDFATTVFPPIINWMLLCGVSVSVVALLVGIWFTS